MKIDDHRTQQIIHYFDFIMTKRSRKKDRRKHPNQLSPHLNSTVPRQYFSQQAKGTKWRSKWHRFNQWLDPRLDVLWFVLLLIIVAVPTVVGLPRIGVLMAGWLQVLLGILLLERVIARNLFIGYMLYNVSFLIFCFLVIRHEQEISLPLYMVYTPLHNLIVLRLLIFAFFPAYPAVAQPPIVYLPTRLGFYKMGSDQTVPTWRDKWLSVIYNIFAGPIGFLLMFPVYFFGLKDLIAWWQS